MPALSAGVVGLDGSNVAAGADFAQYGRGRIGYNTGTLTASGNAAQVSVGTNSFAVGGLVGWNSAWTALTAAAVRFMSAASPATAARAA